MEAWAILALVTRPTSLRTLRSQDSIREHPSTDLTRAVPVELLQGPMLRLHPRKHLLRTLGFSCRIKGLQRHLLDWIWRTWDRTQCGCQASRWIILDKIDQEAPRREILWLISKEHLRDLPQEWPETETLPPSIWTILNTCPQVTPLQRSSQSTPPSSPVSSRKTLSSHSLHLLMSSRTNPDPRMTLRIRMLSWGERRGKRWTDWSRSFKLRSSRQRSWRMSCRRLLTI